MLPLAGILGGAALGAVGNLIAGGGQKAAAQAQAAGIQRGADAYQDYYQQGQQQLQPWQQAGTDALGQYQNLMTTQGQGDFYNEYMNSPMFQAMRAQAEDANLRAASATGGLRTGQTGVALSSIAPQLANQAYSQQLSGLQGLMNTGYGASTTGAGMAQNAGANLANMYGQQGIARGNAASAMPMAFGNTAGQLGGLAMYTGQGGFQGLA